MDGRRIAIVPLVAFWLMACSSGVTEAPTASPSPQPTASARRRSVGSAWSRANRRPSAKIASTEGESHAHAGGGIGALPAPAGALSVAIVDVVKSPV